MSNSRKSRRALGKPKSGSIKKAEATDHLLSRELYVAIDGEPGIATLSEIRSTLNGLPFLDRIKKIVTTGENGVGVLAELWARERGDIEITTLRKGDSLARRNEMMATSCHALVAWWDGESEVMSDMLARFKAKDRGIVLMMPEEENGA